MIWTHLSLNFSIFVERKIYSLENQMVREKGKKGGDRYNYEKSGKMALITCN